MSVPVQHPMYIDGQFVTWRGDAWIDVVNPATEAVISRIPDGQAEDARWSEIDIENAMWTIPAEREPLPGVNFSHRGSKMRTPHLVPLSKQAVPSLPPAFPVRMTVQRADCLFIDHLNIPL